MESGIVIKYNASEGVGYIGQANGSEIFFHYTAIPELALRSKMESGLSVKFKLMKTQIGWEAFNVMVR